MITPIVIKQETGEYMLLANHCISSEESLEMSIAFNRARIKHALAHLPKNIDKCILRYDTRGQYLSRKKENRLRQEFSHIHEIQFLTD